MPDRFVNYNGNGPLMAARKLVAAAEDLRKFKDNDIFLALKQLKPTNQEAMRFLTDHDCFYYVGRDDA